MRPSCVGQALATVANVGLRYRAPDEIEMSGEMLYAYARRELGALGTALLGATLEAGLRAWKRYGVVAREVWQRVLLRGGAGGPFPELDDTERAEAERRRPGGFAPVDGQDLGAIRDAIATYGVAAATFHTHDGWFDLFDDACHPILCVLRAFAPAGTLLGPAGAAARGVTPGTGRLAWPAPDSLHLGQHAVAVLGYDRGGFWIQNSFGRRWGRDGLAYVTVEDWLANVRDVWVAWMGRGG